MSDIQEEQKRLYKRAEENDKEFKSLDELNNIEEMRKRYKNILNCLDKTIFENNELQDRINKATEYIKECSWSNGIDEETQYSLHVPTLLNILQGSDKE